MASRKTKPAARRPRHNPQQTPADTVGVRIIGGRFRGRKLQYSGDPRVRPMKDRLREALFNRIGPSIRGKHALDLFAGTGALGLEALSRGAVGATFIEQHRPTADFLHRNLAALEVEPAARIVLGDVFTWAAQSPPLGAAPWAVFCSPPYDYYVDRPEAMLALVGGLMHAGPGESVFVVEADVRFDFRLLPEADAWDVRSSRPAVIGLWRKPP